MNTSTRVLTNTIVLYVKIIVNLVINLILTRIVLKALGIDDFGIYNLIAGVIALLTFVQSALMSSSQRFISVALGEGDHDKTRRYFAASLFIHVVIGLLIVLILEICGLFIFNGFLNIPYDRLEVAKIVYHIMVASTMFTMLGITFHATINSFEDIWYYGLTQIACTLFRLGVVWGFAHINCDKLMLYSIWMALSIIVGELCSIVWCFIKYDICKGVRLKFGSLKQDIKEITGFVGWNTLGAFAIVARNQGISIVLNKFFGTGINGVFGLANQVDGQLSSFANNLTASLSPQIVKSYGQGDKKRLQFLSLFASKLAFFLSAIFAIPLIVELPIVLKVWLDDVPQYADVYIKYLLVTFLICELYPGLSRGIQAVGIIKWQQIWSSIFVIAPIPIGIIMFNHGTIHYAILYVMIIMQFFSLVVHMYWSNKLYELNILKVSKFIILAAFTFLISYLIGIYIDNAIMNNTSELVRFCIVVISVCALFAAMYFTLCFDRNERNAVKSLIQHMLEK